METMSATMKNKAPRSFEVFGPGGMVMPVMVIVIAVYLVMLAAKAKSNKWTS